MADELANAASLCLRQHADSPVDWREWAAVTRSQGHAVVTCRTSSPWGTATATGDQLPRYGTGSGRFPGGPGNTFGDAAAFRTIMRSLRERLFVLDDDTWVYPGHGDDTTLGAERGDLDAWEARGW